MDGLLLFMDFGASVMLEYYLFAMTAVLIHCFCDEGIVWNQRKALWAIGYAVCNSIGDIVLEDSILLVEFGLASIILLYGCKGKYIKRLLLCIYVRFVICFMYAGIVLLGINYFLSEIVVDKMINEYGYMISLILAVFLAFCYYRMKSLYLKKEVHIRLSKKEYAFFGAYTMFIIVMYALLTLAQEDVEIEQGIHSFLVLVLIIFCIMFPLYLIRGQVSNYYQGVKEYQELFLQEQLKALEQYKAAEEETKRVRHDMKNNLSCIAMLLQNEKTQEATEYVENLLQDIKALSPKVITGDEMLNCIFSAKLDWMQKEGIQFEIDGVLDRGLDWKPIDICKVFANAITKEDVVKEEEESSDKLTEEDIPLELEMLFYGVIFIVFGYLGIYYYYAYTRSRSLRITEKNFPEVYELIESYAKKLQMKETPKAYIMQSNGVLNAFSAFIFRKQYIEINAEIFEVAYREHHDMDSLGFVIAHEMAHVYYGHATLHYNIPIWFVKSIPIISATASRAREYSVDRLAQRISGSDGVSAMFMLMVDRHLYKMVDREDYLQQAREQKGFFIWWVNLIADHPILSKRILALDQMEGSGKLY